MNPLIECNSCCFGYDPSRLVLDDVSFSINEGDVVALLGPNGAGKSTLLKLLLHRLQPKKGQITLEGKPVASYAIRDLASRVGYVEQLTPRSSMAVIEYVLLGAVSQFATQRFWYSSEEKHRATSLLSDFGISHLSNHSVDQISGGEQQLVQISRALMPSPKLLLLDEPVSHLDIQHIDIVIKLLLAIAKERRVAVLTTIHDIYLATSFCNRMLLLDTSGKLSVEENSQFPDHLLLEKVFNASFEEAVLSQNNQKVIIPQYRFM